MITAVSMAALFSPAVYRALVPSAVVGSGELPPALIARKRLLLVVVPDMTGKMKLACKALITARYCTRKRRLRWRGLQRLKDLALVVQVRMKHPLMFLQLLRRREANVCG